MFSIEDSPSYKRFRRSISLPSLRRKYSAFLISSQSLLPPESVPNPTPQPAVMIPSLATANSRAGGSTQVQANALQLQDAINTALQHAWSPGSTANHRTAINKFLAFCDEHSIPDAARLPATEELLCAFIASQRNRAPSTLKNYISGLRAWHITNGVHWEGSTRLQYVREGMSNMSAAVLKSRPPRPPITREMLNTLHLSLTGGSYEDICILACADTAFWGQCRLGELLLQSDGPIPAVLPVPSGVALSDGAMGTIELKLPYTKTKKWAGDKSTLTQQSDISNPVLALKKHLRLNSVPATYPLFSFRSGQAWTILTKSHFLSRCNAIWSKNNLPRYTGHSFRIGGTTAMLLGGVHPDIVKEMGRWSSAAYLRYWREFHILIPLNAQNIPLPPTPSRQPLSAHHAHLGLPGSLPAAAAAPRLG